MTLPVFRHDLDPTGTSLDNRVVNEPTTLGGTAVRVFIPIYGAFFGDSMVITDTATAQILLSTQYYLSQHAHVPTMKYGKGIYYCVIVTDQTVSPNLSITYQALGGDWAYANSVLAERLSQLLSDDRPIDFNLVINRPPAYFPGGHLHDSGDIYGMEYVVESLYAIRDAINIDRSSTLATIFDRTVTAANSAYTRVQEVRTEIYQSINGVLDQLNSLVTAVNNSNTRLDKVNNYATATPIQAATGTASNLYVTPAGVKAAIDAIPNPSVVSADPGNLISVRADGIYYGTVAPADISVLFINNATGNDNAAGTIAAPMRTIQAALARGPGGIDRTIRLYEGQNHLVDPANIARLRGGNLDITPYGPLTDLIPNTPGDSRYSTQECLDLNTRITAMDWVNTGVPLADGGSGIFQSAAAFIPVNGKVFIIAVTLIAGKPNLSGYPLSSNAGSFSNYYTSSEWVFRLARIKMPHVNSRLFDGAVFGRLDLTFYQVDLTDCGPGMIGTAGSKKFVFDAINLVSGGVLLTSAAIMAKIANTLSNPYGYTNITTNLTP